MIFLVLKRATQLISISLPTLSKKYVDFLPQNRHIEETCRFVKGIDAIATYLKLAFA
jgi:hypothetical protein